MQTSQISNKNETTMDNKRKGKKEIHLYDIHKLVQLFYNLAQNLFSSGHDYSKESLVLVQTNCKGLNVVTPPSKNPRNSVYYTALVSHKHRNCMPLHSETKKQIRKDIITY